jgi:hypothetical protein
VGTLSENIFAFDSIFAVDGSNLWLAASIFTGIGVLFDLYKAYYFCKEKEARTQEEEQKAELTWKRSNIIFEEIPQFFILVTFLIRVDEQCTFGDTCDEDLYNETYNSAIVSIIFTAISIWSAWYRPR